MNYEGSKLCLYCANIPYFGAIISRDPQLSQLGGRGHRAGGKGGGLQGGRGQGTLAEMTRYCRLVSRLQPPLGAGPLSTAPPQAVRLLPPGLQHRPTSSGVNKA